MYFLYCILALWAATVIADDPIVSIKETNPIVNKVEKKIISEKNFDVQMTCEVENRPLTRQVQWEAWRMVNGTRATVPIATATRSYDPFKYSIDLPSPTAWRMRIQNAQVTDEGIYTCKVQISDKNYATAREELVIIEKPQIADLETSSDVSKNEAQSVTLKCNATGRPTPNIKWTRMAGELLPSGGREHLKSTLVIPSLEAQHAGIYKCTASNSAGKDHRNIRVTVNFSPVLRSANTVVQQAVGYVKELICDIKGYPPPKEGDITWTKRGSSLGFGSHVYVRNIPGASSRITSILVFWGVQEDDYGEYTCAAKNDKGAGSLKFRLQRSSKPTKDRTNQIRAGASFLAVNMGTIIMLLSVCLLHRLGFH